MIARRIALGTLLLALTLAGPAILLADGGQTETTVRGEILDMACYIAHEAKGADHAKCAEKCVKEDGQPMGLLAEDGTVYLLYASHKDGSGFEQAKSLAGRKVEITGKHASRGDMEGLEVLTVKAL